MDKQIRTVLKKTAKVAGVTCIAAGAVAVITSGVAVKAIAEGGKYLVNAVNRIVHENQTVVDAEAAGENTVEAEMQ